MMYKFVQSVRTLLKIITIMHYLDRQQLLNYSKLRLCQVDLSDNYAR